MLDDNTSKNILVAEKKKCLVEELMRSLTADWVATFELLELVGVGMDFVTSSFTYLLFHLVIHTSGNTLLSSIDNSF